MNELHHIKIESPWGHPVLTRVSLDGEFIRGVLSVGFQTGPFQGQRVNTVTLVLAADVEIEGELEVIKVWRKLRPSRLRLFWQSVREAIVR